MLAERTFAWWSVPESYTRAANAAAAMDSSHGCQLRAAVAGEAILFKTPAVDGLDIESPVTAHLEGW